MPAAMSPLPRLTEVLAVGLAAGMAAGIALGCLASLVVPDTHFEWRVALLIWVPALLVGVFASRRFAAARQRRERADEGRCLSCGYDLRASPGRCPECGSQAAGGSADRHSLGVTARQDD